MLENGTDILQKLHKKKSAVAQFNINNLEWTKYILEECEALESPVILGVSEKAAQYMGGYFVVSSMVWAMLRDLNITIPVCLHLDHGSCVSECKKAIDCGFTSVMLDASSYSIEENIAMVKEVVAYAHSKAVTVEAEVGKIGNRVSIQNDSDQIFLDCVRLVEETGVDFLAPSLGTVHGLHTGMLRLDFALLERLHKALPTPLVLHGGSGVDPKDIQDLIAKGIVKININTELQTAWQGDVKKFVTKFPQIYDPKKIIGSGESAIKKMIRSKISLLQNN